MTTFNAVRWLERAEAAGYSICFVQPGGEVYFGGPNRTVLTNEEDLELWRELRPSIEAAEPNAQALRAHLRKVRNIYGWPESAFAAWR